ncbi:cyclic nucleotide-binding domain-containing protein [Nitrospira sp. Kam-Ns4a]
MDLGPLLGKIATLALACAAVVVWLAVLARRRGRRVSPSIPVGAGATVGLASLLLLIQAEMLPVPSLRAMNALRVAAWLCASFFVLKALDLAVIGEYLIERRRAHVPQVVRTLVLGAGLVVAGLVVLEFVLHVNPIALVAVPTVATAVVGVALRDTLVRFFSGISLGKMIRVGDWISVLNYEGIVTEISFSHVTIMTRQQHAVILPNDNVVRSGIVNYSRAPAHICSILVEVADGPPPMVVCGVLTEAAGAVEGVLRTPKPEATLSAFTATGMEFRLKFAIRDYGRAPEIEGRARTYVWSALRRLGIPRSSPRMTVQMEEAGRGIGQRDEADRFASFLIGIDFVSALSAEQVQTLARGARSQEFLPGEKVVRQGEPGEELFVILDGAADVVLEHEGEEKILNTLQAGQFFGEISLLTGEPRSATVVAKTPLRVMVLGKQTLSGIIVEQPELIARISELVASRRVQSAAARQQMSQEHAKLALEKEARSLMGRIQRFFQGKPAPARSSEL